MQKSSAKVSSCAHRLQGQLSTHCVRVRSVVFFRVELRSALLLHSLGLNMQLTLHLAFVLVGQLVLGVFHFDGALILLLLLPHDHLVLLQEHLLLALANSVDISLRFLLDVALVQLFNLHILLLFHLFAELEVLDQLSLGLSLLLHFALQTSLALLLLGNAVQSFLLIVCDFLSAPLPQLLFDLLPLVR